MPEPARQAPKPRVSAPPPKTPSANPDAPHGFGQDGKPQAPYGTYKNGRPRPRPAPEKSAGKPRVAPSATSSKSEPESYADDLRNLGVSAWLGLSAFRGGQVLGFKLPDTRPYAAIVYQALPDMVVAWDQAAQQNAQVRGWVKKFSGDGSWSWMIGVGVSGASLVAGCVEMSRAPAELKAQAADANDRVKTQFIEEQMKAMGLGQEQVQVQVQVPGE